MEEKLEHIQRQRSFYLIVIIKLMKFSKQKCNFRLCGCVMISTLV